MADIFMRIAMGVAGSDVVISAVKAVAGSFGGFGNLFSGMRNSLSMMSYGFQSWGQIGGDSMTFLQQGAVGLGQGFLSLGLVAGAVVAGIAVGIGIVAVKAAGDFQASMTRLVTSAGEFQSNIAMVSAGILQMSVDTATSTDQLAAGMYYVESSSYHGAIGLAVLTNAAKGAKSENADLTVVSKALTTEMVDYHMKAGTAAEASLSSAQAMNGLIATVQNGKTNLQELSASMGAVLPIASALGISFPQVAGALDTMTNAGMPAQQAAQNLSHVLVALNAPSKVATKAMLDVGLSAQQVKDTLVHQGLPEALQLIEDHVGKKFPAGSVENVTALKNIMGGLVGVKLAAMLTGGSLAETKTNIDKITAAMKSGSQGVMGFTDVQNTFNFKVDQARQMLQAWLIQLGTQLMPVFSKLMTVLLPLIQGFLNWVVTSGIVKTILQGLINTITFLVTVGTALVNFFKNNEVAMAALKATLILLAVVVGTVMVIAIVAWTIAAWNAAAANIAAFWPVYLVILIIIVVITLVVLAIQHWGQIVQFVGGIFSWLGTVAHTVVTAIGQFFSDLGTKVHLVWMVALAGLTAAWNAIKSVAMTVWGAISNFFIGVWNAVAGFFVRAWQGIWTNLVATWNTIKTIALVIFALIVYIIILPFVPLIDWFRAHWTQIHAVLTASWNMIKSVAATVWGALSGFFVTVWDVVSSAFTAAWNAIKGFLTTAWNDLQVGATVVWGAISSFFLAFWTPVSSFFQTAWADISSGLSTAWNDISNAASSAWNTISTNIMNVVNPLLNILKNAWNTVKSDFSNAFNALASIAQSAWDGVAGAIRTAINTVISVINGMINNINSVTSRVGVPAIPTIPYLAQGVTNFRGGLAVVGEQGPELVQLPGGANVIPMSRTGVSGGYASSSMGPTNHFYISISTMARSQAEVARLVDMFEQEVASRVRSQTPGYSTGVF